MSLTRFNDDPARIQKKLHESTYAEGYYINAPGNGVVMPFQEDVQLRLQNFAANRTTNTVNLESDFRGLTRILNRDTINENQWDKHEVESFPIHYPNSNPFIDESRASHPAWMYRDLEQTRWEHPWINPQDNAMIPFPTDVQTRILEKDYYVPQKPILTTSNFGSGVGSQPFYDINKKPL